jgi:hypothetical protein
MKETDTRDAAVAPELAIRRFVAVRITEYQDLPTSLGTSHGLRMAPTR